MSTTVFGNVIGTVVWAQIVWLFIDNAEAIIRAARRLFGGAR